MSAKRKVPCPVHGQHDPGGACTEHGPDVAFSPTEDEALRARLVAAWHRNVARDEIPAAPGGFDVFGFDRRYRRFIAEIEIEQGFVDTATNTFHPNPPGVTRAQYDASTLRTFISALVEGLEKIKPDEPGVTIIEETVASLQAIELGLRPGAHDPAEWAQRLASVPHASRRRH